MIYDFTEISQQAVQPCIYPVEKMTCKEK